MTTGPGNLSRPQPVSAAMSHKAPPAQDVTEIVGVTGGAPQARIEHLARVVAVGPEARQREIADRPERESGRPADGAEHRQRSKRRSGGNPAHLRPRR